MEEGKKEEKKVRGNRRKFKKKTAGDVRITAVFYSPLRQNTARVSPYWDIKAMACSTNSWPKVYTLYILRARS